MIKYFKELLSTLRKIEQHLSKIAECVKSRPGDSELKVGSSVPKCRKY